MPELDAEHRNQMAEALRAASRDTCDEVECDPEFTADYCREALEPLIAGWLAEAAAGALRAAADAQEAMCDTYRDQDAPGLRNRRAWVEWLRDRAHFYRGGSDA